MPQLNNGSFLKLPEEVIDTPFTDITGLGVEQKQVIIALLAYG